MLLFSRLRAAELLGLTWQDIDFEQRVIRVRYQISRQGERTPLKTQAGRRKVILMDELAHRLRKHRLAARFSADAHLIVANGVGKTSATRASGGHSQPPLVRPRLTTSRCTPAGTPSQASSLTKALTLSSSQTS